MASRLRHITTCIALGAVVAAFGFACWFAPKDDYSESERRALAGFPPLSIEAVASGRFMDQFETYAQDAFPFRDAFRTAKALTSDYLFLKMDNNGLYTVHVENFATETSDSSRTSIVSLEYPLDVASVIRATERFGLVYEQYLANGDANVYVSVIPDKGYYLAEPSGHLSMDYESLFSLVKDGMPYATYLDITDQLNGTSYYLTDPHWRQESLLGVANVLTSGMKAEGFSAADSTDGASSAPAASSAPTTSSEQATQTASSAPTATILTDEFYGSLYGQAALPVKPDTLVCLDSATIDAAIAYDHQNNRPMPVYDLAVIEEAFGSAEDAAASDVDGKAGASNATGNAKIDLYDFFLGGPLSLVTIESPLAKTDKSLVIFRDSFASSLAPLLLESYAKITLVDIRYLQPALLGEYVDFENADVLFLYSTSVLNNSETIR